MNKLISLILIYFVSINCYSASYIASAVEINNDILSTSKIFVSGNKVRMEYNFENEKFIQISNPQKRRSWVVFPKDKTYIETKSSSNILPKSLKMNIVKTCKPKAIKCRKEKIDLINERPATRWRIEVYKKINKKLIKNVSYLWIDNKLSYPVKQQYENGSYTDLMFIKNETVLGRKTQKWQLKLVNRFQESIVIYQWYDLKLNLTIKELYPDNSVKMLQDIKLKKLDNDLFIVPKGYSKRTSFNK